MTMPWMKPGGSAGGLTYMRHIEQATFLVVDDFEAMRRITINQLRQMGAKRMLEAANGAEAMEILRRENVSMVISDWNMPVMSGLELLLAVRGDSNYAALPFIMITAEAERERVQRAIDAGVSELLVKPYTPALFTARLERGFSRAARRPVTRDAEGTTVQLTDTPQGPLADVPHTAVAGEYGDPTVVAEPAIVPEDGEPTQENLPTILVVDDTPDNLHLLAQMFKDDYRVKLATNGKKALAICQGNSPPDLILLDVMMPDMDGFDVAKALRANPASDHIPIIFVTALTDEHSRLRGLELGAVEFVSKPINPHLLRVRVRNFMRYISMHRELQASYDAMMEAAHLKEEVEQITRHDLKGPLAAVIGLIQSVQQQAGLSNEQQESLRLAEEAALQTIGIINLSAELYKIETGRFVLKPQAVAVGQVLERLSAMSRKAYAARGLRIDFQPPRNSLVASGDQMFCYSIFQNLLKNACEAAPPNSTILVTIKAEGNEIVTSIGNGGTVPTAIRERFFDKFATAGKDGGTGIGTYSARLLTEAQGGSIAMATSDADNKTELTVRLMSHQA
jgi:two-component system sensor histidine kinase/response regulator